MANEPGGELDPVERVVRILTPHDPFGSATKALACLCADSRAHTGAVFAPVDTTQLRLRYSSGCIDQQIIDNAETAWRTARDQLERGEWWRHVPSPPAADDVSTARAALVIPLLAGGEVAGLLCLDFIRPERLDTVDPRAVVPIGRIIAACISAPDTPLQQDDFHTHLTRLSAREARRALLEGHLADTRGNIKEVARRMGKSRPTIYAWMDEFGIQRPRGPRVRRNDP